MGNSVVFIDPRIGDYQELLAAIDPTSEVVLLDPDQDGLRQIADWADARSGIDAVHIISHGAPANIQLGTADISLSTLSGYKDLLNTIGSALTPDADILLYGCDVASGPEGLAFVNQFAML